MSTRIFYYIHKQNLHRAPHCHKALQKRKSEREEVRQNRDERRDSCASMSKRDPPASVHLFGSYERELRPLLRRSSLRRHLLRRRLLTAPHRTR
nr:hypothetical protein Itr_chr11CG03740 [Ipomoea trifida]